MIFGWFFAFCFFPAAQAQDVRHLSFQEATELVEKNNPELRAQDLSLTSAQALERVAGAGFFPQISANVEGSQSHTSGTTTNSNSAGLSVSQNLFAGFADDAKVKQARANTETTRAVRRALRSRLSLDLKTAFQGLAYTDEYIKLTKALVQRRRENLRLVELLFHSGLENRGSVLLSRANLAQAEYEELQAQSSRAIAQAQLTRVLGLEDQQTVYLEGNIPLHEPAKSTPDFLMLAKQAPDFLQAVSQTAANSAAIDSAQSSFWPSLTASASVGKTGPEFFPQNDKWTAGLNFSLPLFNGFRDQSNVQSAKALFSASRALEDSVRRRILVDLRQGYNDFLQSLARLKVDEAYRDAAQLRAEIARKNYNNGLLKFENWDPIENDFILRQKNFLQSRRDRVVAEAKWENAQGLGALP